MTKKMAATVIALIVSIPLIPLFERTSEHLTKTDVAMVFPTEAWKVKDQVPDPPRRILSGHRAGHVERRHFERPVAVDQTAFFVYKSTDSGFNHGFASGWFANPISNHRTISLDAACVDDPADTTTGCYPLTDTSALDTVRGTVLRFTFAAQAPGDWVGVNIEEPEHWGVLQTGIGYDLRGATSVTFDVRSPDGARVQFGVGECTAPYAAPLPSTWTTMTMAISSLGCQPDLSNVHVLFGVAVSDISAPNGATVLLDNIQFSPVPARATQTQEGETFSLPQSNQAFAAVAQSASPFPPDQANRNFAAIYEAALTIRVLNNQGDAPDAQDVANAIDYALYHDNQGDYLSAVPNGTSGCFSGAPATQCGLHDAYESGDIALFDDENPTSGAVRARESEKLKRFDPDPATSLVAGQFRGTVADTALAVLDGFMGEFVRSCEKRSGSVLAGGEHVATTRRRMAPGIPCSESERTSRKSRESGLFARQELRLRSSRATRCAPNRLRSQRGRV
jgi:hypothetical protein